MNQNMSSRYDQASAQPLPFKEAVWQLPLQYIKVFIKPSVNTLSEEMSKASWGIVLVQFLSLFIITVTMPTPYLYEKLAQAHHEDVLREAERLRLLVRLPRHRLGMSRRAASKLGVLLLKLGTWLKQFEQPSTALEEHV